MPDKMDDTQRLDWLLPILGTAEDDRRADARIRLLAKELVGGKRGRDAIDAAIAAESKPAEGGKSQ